MIAFRRSLLARVLFLLISSLSLTVDGNPDENSVSQAQESTSLFVETAIDTEKADGIEPTDAQKVTSLPPILSSLAASVPTELNLNLLCSRVDCARHAACLTCDFGAHHCRSGEPLTVNCTTHVACIDQHTVVRADASCRYCWQTIMVEEHRCEPVRNCSSNDVRLHRTVCRVASNVVCMGRRTFYKNVKCRWTNGYSWTRTLFYSVTLGGFGVDRFYLGLWKSGIGKLFSFGGLGVWTLVDIVLVAIGYIQPADGSMYI